MNFYPLLAKQAVENFVQTKKIIDVPDNIPPAMLKEKAGVFVTITKNGELRGLPRTELRGCIGTYLPQRENIALEIIHNAIAAATEDPRFPAVTPEELPQLCYTVYILEKPAPIKKIEELDPKKYGIFVYSDTGKSGLLLPDLDGIETAEQQLNAVCWKCGIIPSKEQITICRFKAEKHEGI